MRYVSVLMMLFVCSSLNAATITYVGSTEGGEVADWRTAGVSKTMDIDGDDVYGSTLGGIHWKVTGFNQKSWVSSDFERGGTGGLQADRDDYRTAVRNRSPSMR